MRATDKRMTSERCAFLSLVAIAHKLEEAWLCFFPVLPLMYISQYLPTIGKRFVVGLVQVVMDRIWARVSSTFIATSHSGQENLKKSKQKKLVKSHRSKNFFREIAFFGSFPSSKINFGHF